MISISFLPTLLWIFGVLHYVPNVASLGFGELRKQNLHSLLHKTSAFSVYFILLLRFFCKIITKKQKAQRFDPLRPN